SVAGAAADPLRLALRPGRLATIEAGATPVGLPPAARHTSTTGRAESNRSRLPGLHHRSRYTPAAPAAQSPAVRRARSGPADSRTRHPESPPRTSVPGSTSPPSARPDPGRSECLTGVASRQPWGCTPAAPPEADTPSSAARAGGAAPAAGRQDRKSVV